MAQSNAYDELVTQTHNGHGLPASCYKDQAFYERELKTAFANNWACIGTVNDVPEPGDIKTMVFAGASLLMVRGRDGEVRVFHNYCRHRGLRLVNEPCAKRNRLVCPYHGWMYELDGALIRTPHIAGPDDHDGAKAGIDLPDGLHAVRMAVWNQLVFVNVSGTADEFSSVISVLEERWSDYDFSRLHEAEVSTYDVGCNWKLAVENFIDVYHVPYVHPGLEKYNSFRDHYMVHDGLLSGEGNNNVEPTDDAVGKLPEFPGLPEAKRHTLEALSLFPNLLITVTVDYLRVIIVEPLGPEACREHVKIFVNGEHAATSAELAEHRTQLRLRFEEFNNEDVEIAEELQRSMNGSAFQKAYLSPAFDKAVQTFQMRIAEAVAQEPD